MDMKKKTVLIFILLLLSICFVILNNKEDKILSHKILKVIEADEYIIDINDNNKEDEDEHFKLKDITALKPLKNPYTINLAKNIGIDIEQYIKTGYIARQYAKDSFLNQKVNIIWMEEYNKNNKYRLAKIEFENKDIANLFLKSGLAIAKPNASNPKYFENQNIFQIKRNSAELAKIKFVLVNLKNNTVHFLECEYAKKLQNGELILAKNINKYSPCKICVVNEDKDKESYQPKFENLKNLKTYKTSFYQKFNSIELFIQNPYLYKKPKDNCDTKICKRLCEEINNSKETIDIAIYGFGEQKEIFKALKNAKQRGVKIRSVVDYSKKMDEIYPNTKNFIKEFQSITDKSETLMHNKFIIFDNSKVFTGSYNISQTCTGGYNLNSAVMVNSKELALQYKKEFEQMLKGSFSSLKQKNPNKEINISSSELKVYFMPQNDGYKEGILPLILNSREEIFLSIFYLTDRNLINELIKAHKRGVKVLVMVDAVAANNFKDRIETLRKEKIPVKIENWGGKNHEKTMLIDSKILILGSCNFSKSGFYKNDENFLVIQNPLIAKSYRDFYLYLFNSIDNKFLKLYPKAEGLDSINSCSDGIDNDYDGKIDSLDEGCKQKL